MDEEKGFYDGLTDEEMLDGFGDDEPVEEVKEEVIEELEEEPEQADQPEESEEEPEAEPVEEEKPADQPFTLKHLGETKEYSREETITLAQKGLDYDRIRQDRDTLKSENARLQEHEDFLKELADMSEMTIEDLMVEVKAKVIMADEEKKGNTITLEQAKYRVKSEKKPAKADPVEAKRNASFDRFRETFPDVEADAIPMEVWAEFGDGSTKDLSLVYTNYLHRQELQKAQDEMKQIQARIEAIEQNEKNKKRSTGSRRSNGSPEVDHDFDGWGEY